MLARISSLIANLRKDDDGAALAEYAVIFLVVAIVGVGGLTLVATNIDGAFNAIATWIGANITAAF